MKYTNVQASDVWDYFQENKDQLRNEARLIAGDDDYGVEIFLTSKENRPYFEVYVDGDETEEQYAIDAIDCLDTVEQLYGDYIEDFLHTMIDNQFAREYEDDDEKSPDIEEFESDIDQALAEQEAIDLQESQIDETLETFLETICEGLIKTLFTDEQFEEIKDFFCEYIARKYHKVVYRPMYVEDEHGQEEYVDYPYEEYTFT